MSDVLTKEQLAEIRASYSQEWGSHRSGRALCDSHEALRAEVERMRPVVEAATIGGKLTLDEAVAAYRASGGRP